MNIIFLGTTGVHHALVAANIYLEHLNNGAYYRIEDYANSELESQGSPIYIGQDKAGNRVYSLGGGKDLDMAKKTIEDLTNVLGYSPQDLMVIPVAIRGDRLLATICGIPSVLGGRLWSRLVSAIIIKSQLKTIRQVYQGDGSGDRLSEGRGG